MIYEISNMRWKQIVKVRFTKAIPRGMVGGSEMSNLREPSLLSTQDMTRALVVYSTETDLL